MNLRIRSSGFLTSVQDLGRVGYRRSGISTGGALDSHAMRVANALVGNDDSAAGLEVTLGNLRISFEDKRLVAWCGGAFSVHVAGEDLPAGRAAGVNEGDELVVTAPKTGARAWLAISGGVTVPEVLGSRSTDLRGNFGGYQGRVLRDGDVLPLGKSVRLRQAANLFDKSRISKWGAPSTWTTPSRHRVLRVIRGPDWNRFTTDGQSSLVSEPFNVSLESDRMAIRLDGPILSRNDPSELLSEAVTPGTLQLPSDGKPILLLGDCQTIGGYPKVAHVITVDLPIAAQLWPGDVIRFNEISLTNAHSLLREREEEFARFRIGIGLRYQ